VVTTQQQEQQQHLQQQHLQQQQQQQPLPYGGRNFASSLSSDPTSGFRLMLTMADTATNPGAASSIPTADDAG
jgi:hypothetical protein